MAVRNDFAAGEVLAAADLNDTFASKVDYALTANAQSGTGASAYTFVLADASRLTTATGTSAKTFTIPPQANVAWVANSIIRVANYGTGDLTIAGGSGVTVTNASKTLAQFESAALVRTGSNAWTLIPFSGGAGNADFSDAATGTFTDSGINYKYITYTASGTLTVTKAGFADVLVVGGGGGGGRSFGGGGGSGGHLYATNVYLAAGSITIRVGAGGAGGDEKASFRPSGLNGLASGIGDYIVAPGGGGGGGAEQFGSNGGSGGGGGGGGLAKVSGAGFAPQGNSGGNGSSTSSNFGGGGGGGAGAAGSNGSGTAGGNGGAGLANSITGSSVTRAGGGGGGALGGTGGTGGTGGGGNGTSNNNTGGAGSTNTGGGGGAGGYASGDGGPGGNGGSGVVIVRVKV